MTWNYRIVQHHYSPKDAAKTGDQYWYSLREVYYAASGGPETMTAEPASFVANEDEGPVGIVKALKRALSDAESRLMLDESDLKAREPHP